MERKYTDAQVKKKFQMQQSQKKVMQSVFRDIERVHHF